MKLIDSDTAADLMYGLDYGNSVNKVVKTLEELRVTEFQTFITNYK